MLFRSAIKAGAPVDPVHGQRGKQRSVHNTYFTLPVLFTMLSNHYGFAYSARYNWLVLVALMLAGALIRMSFVLRHKALATGQPVPWRYAVIGTLLVVGVAVAVAPAPQPAVAAAAPATFAQVQGVVAQRCALWHSTQRCATTPCTCANVADAAAATAGCGAGATATATPTTSSVPITA